MVIQRRGSDKFIISLLITSIELGINHKLKPKERIFLKTNGFLQLIVLLSSASRSSFLSLIIFIFVIFFFKQLPRIKNFVLRLIIPSTVTFMFACMLLIISNHMGVLIKNDIGTYLLNVKQVNKPKFTQIDETKKNINNERLTPTATMANRLTIISQTKPVNTPKNEDPTGIEKNESLINKYSSGRILLWQCGINVFINHPIFGAGLYGLEEHMRDETPLFAGVPQERIELDYIHFFSLHNDFLQAFVSTGIIGGLVFTIVMFLIYYYMLKKLFVIYRTNFNDQLEMIHLIAFSLSLMCLSFQVF